MRYQHLDGMTGHPTVTFEDMDTVLDCSQPGVDATEAVVEALRFEIVTLDSTVDECRGYLAECGAWDDLDTADEDTIAERMVWVAAGELREENRPCDQCAEISIQGQRCHETGCPNG